MTDLRPTTSAPATGPSLDRHSMLGLVRGFGTLSPLRPCTPRDPGSLESGEHVRGGVLTYFETQTWTLLYPPSVGFYPNGGIMNNISARLLWQDPETLELHPWLVTERPEISADATTYTFTIRDGVT